MKYYSEVLNKNFDTVEDLDAAEKAEKEKALAKAKEDAARKEEIDAAKKKRDDAKADYEASRKACYEALTRWYNADKEYRVIEARNRNAISSSNSKSSKASSGTSISDIDFSSILDTLFPYEWFSR